MKTFTNVYRRLAADEGVTTAEYAIATCAATGFAGLLINLLTSGRMAELIWRIIEHAFGFLFRF